MAWRTFDWAYAVILLLPTHPHPHSREVSESVPGEIQPGHGKGSDSLGAGLNGGLPLGGHAASFVLQGVQVCGRPRHLDLRRLVGTVQLCQLLLFYCDLQAARAM